MIDWIIFGISSVLILAGLFMSVVSVIGLYRFDFCMNRMHAAAMNDTLGILLVLTGLMISSGFTLAMLKMLIIIIFFWFASPVSGHLLTKLQVIIEKHEAEESGKPTAHYTVGEGVEISTEPAEDVK